MCIKLANCYLYIVQEIFKPHYHSEKEKNNNSLQAAEVVKILL